MGFQLCNLFPRSHESIPFICNLLQFPTSHISFKSSLALSQSFPLFIIHGFLLSYSYHYSPRTSANHFALFKFLFFFFSFVRTRSLTESTHLTYPTNRWNRNRWNHGTRWTEMDGGFSTMVYFGLRFFNRKPITSDQCPPLKSSNFSCSFDAFIHVQTLLNFNIWSCILEHILTYLIVLQYFVIIKTLEELYKSNFVLTICPFFKKKRRRRKRRGILYGKKTNTWLIL